MSAGIGRAEGDLGQLAKMAQRPDAAQRWRKAKVLVIDEVLARALFASPTSSHLLPPGASTGNQPLPLLPLLILQIASCVSFGVSVA